MNMKRVLAVGLATFCMAMPVLAGSHSWRFSELFTNAGGTVQFIEFTCPVAGENSVNGLQVTVVVGGITVNTFTFPNSLPGSTANKKLLLATNGFTTLPGAPARDFALPDNFFPPGGGFTIRYNPPGNYDTNIVAAGAIPTDGIDSLQYTTFLGANGVDTFTTGTNNPTNYAGCVTEICDDNIDNDCDGLTDCDDPACALAVPACVPTVSEWGVLIMALLTLSAGSVMLRQRA